MKKLYTLLLAAIGLSTATTAQTTADLAGRYVMTCESQLNPASSDLGLAPSYNVTITASATAADSVYMDGFLGTPMNVSSNETGLVAGKYDEAAKTITFTVPTGMYLIDQTYMTACVLTAPFVVTVGTDNDGNIQLKQQDEAIYFMFGAEVSVDSTFIANGVIENLTLTKQKTSTISREDLLGTYTFTYVPLDVETYMPGDPQSSKFAIGEEADGSLYIVSLLGASRHVPINYTETGFTIDPIMEETETSAFLICSLSMGAVEVIYGEGGMLNFTSGLALQDNANLTYVYSGTATKDAVNAITSTTTTAATPVKAYTLDGRLAGTGVASKLATQLPAGLYVIGGKKVIVR